MRFAQLYVTCILKARIWVCLKSLKRRRYAETGTLHLLLSFVDRQTWYRRSRIAGHEILKHAAAFDTHQRLYRDWSHRKGTVPLFGAHNPDSQESKDDASYKRRKHFLKTYFMNDGAP